MNSIALLTRQYDTSSGYYKLRRRIILIYFLISLIYTITLPTNSIEITGCIPTNQNDNLEQNFVHSNLLSLKDFYRTDDNNGFDLITNASDDYLNITKYDPNFKGGYWVNHVLDFISCSDIEIFVTITYEYITGSQDGQLYFKAGYKPESGSRDDICEVGYSHCSFGWRPGGYFKVNAYDDGSGGSRYSKTELVPAKGEFIFHIKKENRKITSEVLDLSMKRVFGYTWRSVNFLIPINYLEITTFTYSNSCFLISFYNFESTIDTELVDWETMREKQENIEIALMISGSFILLILIVAIPLFIDKIKKKRTNQKISTWKPPQKISNWEPIDFYEEEKSEVRITGKFLEKAKLVDISILSKKLCCMICKLPFQEEQMIFECSECRSLFHVDHLMDWLLENNDCPVCGYKLKAN